MTSVQRHIDPRTDAMIEDAFPLDEPAAVVAPVSAPPAPGTRQIISLWARLMKSVTHVAKREKYSAVGVNYNFRGIDAVVNAVGPMLRELGIVPEIKIMTVERRDVLTSGNRASKETTVIVRYRWYAPDDSYLEFEIPGEALDTADKGTGKAMSVAYRIFWIQALALPTDEPDPDAFRPERDGTPLMPKWTAQYGRDLLRGDAGTTPANVAALVAFWPAVLEHSAMERPIVEGEDLTWAQGYAVRISAAILKADKDGLMEIYEALKPAGMLKWRAGDTTLGGVIQGQAAVIKAQAEAGAMTHVTTEIGKARTREAVTAAVMCGKVSLEEGVISAERFEELRQVGLARVAKIDAGELDDPADAEPAEETPAEPASEPVEEPPADAEPEVTPEPETPAEAGSEVLAPGPFLAEVNDALTFSGDSFRMAVEGLIDGDYSDAVPPAGSFGERAFVALVDATKGKFFARKEITEEVYDGLIEYIARGAEAVGIDPAAVNARIGKA